MADAFLVFIQLYFYAVFCLPVGVPPGEPDPYLSQVAPPAPLYYIQSSGTQLPAADDGEPTNLTLRLMADPEIRRSLEKLEALVVEQMSRVDQSADKGRPLALLYTRLGWLMFTNPSSLWLEEFGIEEDGPKPRGALLVRVDDDRPRLETLLEELVEVWLESPEYSLERFDRHGETFRLFKGPPGITPVIVGFHRDYFVAGFDVDTLDGIFEREGHEPPPWLTQLQTDLRVDHPSTISYVDVAKVRDRLESIALDDSTLVDLVAAAGIDRLLTYRCVTGLMDDDFAVRTHLSTMGELGALSFLSPSPISEDDLRKVPADSPVVFAMKLDTLKLGRTMAPMLGLAVEDFDQGAQEFSDFMEAEIGVGVEELLTDILSDTVVIYAAPDDGGLVSGWVYMIPVSRSEEAQEVLENLLAMLGGFGGDALEVETEEFEEATIHTLHLPWGFFTDRFVFAVTDTEFIGALAPQPILAHLRRENTEASLADNEFIASAYSADDMQGGGLRMVVQVDQVEVLSLAYPWIVENYQFFFAGLEERKLPFTMEDLPSIRTLKQYAEPSRIILFRADDGYHWEVRQTLPTGDLVAAGPAMLVGYIGLNLGQIAILSRANRIQDLERIADAWSEYQAAHGGFPPRANLSSEGQELLSWRVHILPYLGEQALYDRFHLDEPWDSEHNRQLVEEMPYCYASSWDERGEGLTSYLANATENGVAVRAAVPEQGRADDGSPIGLRLDQLPDGPANTVMLVEVNQENRVVWTQPTDFDTLAMDPMSRLFGNWTRGWLMATADGKVHVCREDLTEEALERLFDRQDGSDIPDFESR